MDGIAQSVKQQYSDAQLRRLTSRRSTASGIYARANGDRTSTMALAQHGRRVSAGFELVDVVDEGGMLTAGVAAVA